ncbi:helix-turn-helix domain-containing protein [Saccharopolyspora gloriosae]|uniref:helix-turn-helix domain-containing protein n=1 Tax=Saccharopolyspora gloriosae TaxID=455344 RepID=UPI0021608FDB|nr:helix-turn-helix domain-containing protein [Saccharopolyspora gloriosae]
MRRWRLKRDLSVRELAKMISVSHGQLSRIEAGSRHLRDETATALDQALGTEGAFADVLREAGGFQPGGWSSLVIGLPPGEELIGRARLLQDLVGTLTPVPSDAARPPRFLALTGTAGIGKTALALAAIHEVKSRFETVRWVDMRAWDHVTGPRSAVSVLRSWCSSIPGHELRHLPNDLDHLVEIWRGLTAGTPLLLGVDNAQSDQIPPLIPAAPGSVIVVTSRDRELELPGPVRWYPVSPLGTDDATDLIAARSGQPRERVAALAPRGAGLPLALRSLGDVLAAHDADQEMIADMAATTAPTDAVRRATALSYRELTDEQARVWRLCASLPEVTPESAEATAGMPEREVRVLLDAAAKASLLTKRGRTWQYHELHRAYALEQSQRVDSIEDRDAATGRTLTYLLHGWANANRRLAPDRKSGPPLVELPQDVHPPEFASFDAALEWAEARWEYMPIAVRGALERNWTRLAWQLVAVSLDYAILAKPYPIAYSMARHAAAHAERAHDREGMAWMAQVQGYIDTERGELDAAIDHLSRAVEFRRELGDVHELGWSTQALAKARLYRGDPIEETLSLLTEAIDSLESIEGGSGDESARTLRGTVHLNAYDHTGEQAHLDIADTDLTQAVTSLPPNGEPLLRCYSHTRLAVVRLRQGRCGEAVELASHAATYAHDHAALFSEVDALYVLGQALHATGHTDQARQHWTRAIDIADYIGSDDAERIQTELDNL